MSESNMSDAAFGRGFVLMALAMTVMAILIAVIAVFASSDVNARLDERSDLENSAAVASRLEPVGKFAANAAGGQPVSITPVEQAVSGEEAYASCGACHNAGIAGAPAKGDVAAWAPRIDKGIETLYANAINGYQGDAGYMPAKGGNMSLSDASVEAAVDYLIETSQ